MKIETLVVTRNQTDFSLIEKMNIQTDAIIGNQTDKSEKCIANVQGLNITYLSYPGKGIGLNRNTVLEHSNADICVFADDDMCFIDGYPKVVKEAFEKVPDADILIFNLIEKKPVRYVNKKMKRVRIYNYAKYGAARFAVRRKSIADKGIAFHLQFGGGAKYGSGEDTIFLKECIKRKLKIIAVPYAIAEIDQTSKSTWFTGYNEKFFSDKGALYACLYDSWAWVFCVRYLFKYYRKYCGYISMKKAFGYMLRGSRKFLRENS